MEVLDMKMSDMSREQKSQLAMIKQVIEPRVSMIDEKTFKENYLEIWQEMMATINAVREPEIKRDFLTKKAAALSKVNKNRVEGREAYDRYNFERSG